MDNVLLMQELVRGYHRDLGPPRCAIKPDLMKASFCQFISIFLTEKHEKECHNQTIKKMSKSFPNQKLQRNIGDI